MTDFRPSIFQVAVFSCGMCLLLFCGCRNDDPSWLSRSMSGSVGPNDEYTFLVAAQQMKDGSIRQSPMLLWKKDVSPAPAFLQWENANDQWSVIRSNTKDVEHRDAVVLLYEGPGRPWRELAPSWEARYIDSSFDAYIETLLPEAEKRAEDPSKEESGKALP